MALPTCSIGGRDDLRAHVSFEQIEPKAYVPSPEGCRPAPQRLMYELDISRGEHVIDQTQAEREAATERDCIADYVLRKPLTLERNRRVGRRRTATFSMRNNAKAAENN